MRYKIKDIGEDALNVDIPLTAAWTAAALPDLEGRPGMAGLNVRGTLQRVGDEFLLRGRLRGVVETPCVRCLETARVPLDEEMIVTFVQRSDRDGKRDDDDEDDDEESDVDIAYFSGDELDLEPEIHDQFALAMPPNPICSPDCAGLCPVCGGNRNENPCDCESRQQQKTSPLAGLGKLKI